MSAGTPSSVSGIDARGAAEAIDAAGGLSNLMENQGQDAGTPSTPESTETHQQLRDPVSGRWIKPGEETMQTATPAEENFSNVDPNQLPPELQAIYKSLQGDYTRKTQELAEQRKLYEQFGGPDQISEAMRLHQSLQNPAYWPQLYSELVAGMEQLGMSPAEAQQAVDEQLGQTQGVGQQTNLLDDPDLAPIKQMFDSMQGELATLRNDLNSRAQAEKQERLELAILGEMQRQENLIRQMNPGYTDEDIGAIYELSSYHQGDLLQAQQRYEDIATNRLTRFLQQKEQAVGNTGVGPVVGGQTISSQPQTYGGDLNEAHKAAMERLRQIEAQE